VEEKAICEEEGNLWRRRQFAKRKAIGEEEESDL
jgi:hypothetical protein